MGTTDQTFKQVLTFRSRVKGLRATRVTFHGYLHGLEYLIAYDRLMNSWVDLVLVPYLPGIKDVMENPSNRCHSEVPGAAHCGPVRT